MTYPHTRSLWPVYDGRMTVFGTHTKTRHVRNLFILVGLCAIVAGGAFAARSVREPLMAAIRDAIASPSSPAPLETVFPQPRMVDWEGVVFGVLAGGEGLAIKRTDTGELFQAYGTQEQTASASYGPVHITGRWTGISCAYQQTVFSGQCTPTVEIDALEILPIVLQ